jgi:hypothetical protein
MLAQTDVNRGVLTLRQSRIRDAIKGLIVNLADREDEAALGADLPKAGAMLAGAGPVRRGRAAG